MSCRCGHERDHHVLMNEVGSGCLSCDCREFRRPAARGDWGECLEINLTDLAGMMVLREYELEEGKLAHDRWTDAFRSDDESGRRVWHAHVLHTDDGVIVFASHYNSLDETGRWFPNWFPHACGKDGPILCTGVLAAGRKHANILVLVDERTGQAVLELGTLNRRDDDPNMRRSRLVLSRFDRAGFESRFLEPFVERDEGATEIRHQFEFTPKRVGWQGRGSAKGRF